MGEYHEKKKKPCENKVSRRGFLKSMGVGAAVATSARISGQESGILSEKPTGEMVEVTLDVNQRKHRLLVEPRWSLLFVLRERLGLTGTKAGCERGECGSCTVLIDDVPRYSCMTLALEAQGKSITTIEGLLRGEELGLTQQAFLETDAFQCGYCTPGQIMAIEGLLRAKPDASDQEIQRAMSGNLCRCGAYPNIFKAAHRAAELKKGEGSAS